MPLFLSSLVGALFSVLGSFVGRVLVSLGLGYVSYTGINTSIQWASSQAIAKMSGLGAVVQFLGVLKVGQCISIIASAYAMRLLLNGLVGGTLTRMVQK